MRSHRLLGLALVALLVCGCQSAPNSATTSATPRSGGIWIPEVTASPGGVTQSPGTGDVGGGSPSSDEIHKASPSSDSISKSTVLGPKGLGALRLGMKKAAARDTGLVSHVMGTQGTCASDNNDGWLKAAGQPAADESAGMLAFSTGNDRLIAIYAFGDVTTPEGIGLGSTKKEVLSAYPDWIPAEGASQGLGLVAAPGNPKASYGIWVDHGMVVELDLELNNHDCWG